MNYPHVPWQYNSGAHHKFAAFAGDFTLLIALDVELEERWKVFVDHKGRLYTTRVVEGSADEAQRVAEKLMKDCIDRMVSNACGTLKRYTDA